MTAAPSPDPLLVGRRADVLAVLADPGLHVETAPPPGAPGTLAWLRASVARFCEGEPHRARRAAAEALLAPLGPTGLRRAAERATHAELDAAAGRPLDAVARLARPVPAAVLAAGLGVAPEQAAEAGDAVGRIARGLRPGAGRRTLAEGDAAVAALLRLLPARAPADSAPAAGVLVQACDATAGLVALAARAALRAPRHARPAAGEAVDAVLRTTPPVRTTRRRVARPGTVAGRRAAVGALVVVDLDAAGLPFGAGRRPCPGEAHARALAAGVLTPLLERAELVPGRDGGDEPPAHLRLPARLLVVAP